MQNTDKRQKMLANSRLLRTRRQFLHPTKAPYMISFLLFLLFSLAGGIFHIHYPEWFQNILMLAFTSSFGISGLIILIRGEFVGKQGEISHGWEVYIYGIVFTLFGFGMTLAGLHNIFSK